MTMTYNDRMNFSDINDVCWLLSAVLDDYVPRQLENFNADTIYDAIQQLKFEGFDITGNSLWAECVYLEIDKVRSKVAEIFSFYNYEEEYNLNFDETEKSVIEQFINDSNDDKFSDGEVFNVFVNGSLDSHIFIRDNYDLEITVLSLLHRETGLLDELEQIGLDVDNINSLADNYIENIKTADYMIEMAKEDRDYE